MKTVVALGIALSLAACGREAQQNSGGAAAPPAPGEAPAPPAKLAAGDYTVLGPFTHENLSVFLLQKPGAPKGGEAYLSLEEAFKAGVVKVTETGESGDVNRLEVENAGDRPVYIQAGDTVKGGKQDRTLAVDLVLKPKSGKTAVEAFCVEPGRWAARSAEEGSLSGATFALSPAPVATKEQKLAIKERNSQQEVWSAGRETNSGLSRNAAGPTIGVTLQDSYVLAAEDPQVQKKAGEYVKALEGVTRDREELVGMAYAVNGETNTAEIYASSGLFLKLWPKLLKGAALEALSKKPEKPAAKSVGADQIAAFLADSAKGEGRQRALPGDMQAKIYQGKDAVLFDTEIKGEILHRQIIRK